MLVRLPRLEAVAVSPDERSLVLTSSSLSADKTERERELYTIDLNDPSASFRMELPGRSPQHATFLHDGSFLFTTAAETEALTSPGRSLWRQQLAAPAAVIATFDGGIESVSAAADADNVALKALLLPGALSCEEDVELARCRRETGTSLIVFDEYPVRFLDSYLGPRLPALVLLRDVLGETPSTTLLSEPATALCNTQQQITPDGNGVISTWFRRCPGGSRELDLVWFTETGSSVLATAGDFSNASVSPDGRFVAALMRTRGAPNLTPRQTLWLVNLDTGEGCDLLPNFDLWPGPPGASDLVWSHDSGSIYFVADERGHAEIYQVSLADRRPRRVTHHSGAFRCLNVCSDGRIYALRSAIDLPPELVAVTPDGTVSVLVRPEEGGDLSVARRIRASRRAGTAAGEPAAVTLPGERVEVSTIAQDGAEIRGTLVLPPEASAETPAPLLLWIHGGPLESFNLWSWRSCPYPFTAAGYAVLMPDPALSTGYGQRFIERAWNDWGGNTFTDLMRITDAALQRSDLDADRTAAIGSSFGGYMTNWIAGHTSRFRAIVTHAGFWNLEQFIRTTDTAWGWEFHFGDPERDRDRYVANSPSTFAANLSTPMLVSHGAHDFRVPLGEALALWSELQRRDVASRFLYFPDEGHWVDRPGNSAQWYETVMEFLNTHVLENEGVIPAFSFTDGELTSADAAYSQLSDAEPLS